MDNKNIEKEFDLLVIGGGPGGTAAAIKASKAGMLTAVVEARSELGGTCLNVGCIPSKALLDTSELFYRAKWEAPVHGISFENLQIDCKAMMARKDRVVATLARGLAYTLSQSKVEVIKGVASFVDSQTISVVSSGQPGKLYRAKRFLIATGSSVATLPNIPLDGKQIISSDQAIALEKIPPRIIVLGGGAIGCEMACVYGKLGSQVTIVELAPHLLAAMDKELGNGLQKIFKKYGFITHLNARVEKVTKNKSGVSVQVGDTTLEADILLVAVGRKPNVDSLALDKAGVTVDEKGFIPVNQQFATSVGHIFAIGDVIGHPMLAHKAEVEATWFVSLLQGKGAFLHYHLLPNVVYTFPEVASVGMTEAQLKADQISYSVGISHFKSNGRAHAAEHVEGFVKILAHSQTHEILGFHALGPNVSDMTALATAAMAFKATSHDIASLCFAHPTYSEAIKLAAESIV